MGTEGNTSERAWVSLGERRKPRPHNSIHRETVSPENAMMAEQQREHLDNTSSHPVGEHWAVQSNCFEPSNTTFNTSMPRQLPQGGIFGFKGALPNLNPRTLRNAGGVSMNSSGEIYTLNLPPPSRHVEVIRPLNDNFRVPNRTPSETNEQQVFENRASHFMDMGLESGSSISPGFGEASVGTEEKLDESATEMNASTAFNTPVNAVDSPNLPTVPTSNPLLTSEPIIKNPLSLAGQRIGALLSIMRVPNKIKKITKGSAFNMVMEVGDVVKVLERVTVSDTNGKDHLDYAVENLRTGARVIVAWSTFLPVGIREMCDCRGQRCRCIYVDFEKSRDFFGGEN